MKDLLKRIDKTFLIFWLEVFVLTTIIITPSIITFSSSIIPFANLIIPIITIHLPFLLLVIFSKKSPRSFSIVLFVLFAIYVFVSYWINSFYDIYANERYGIVRLFSTNASFFIILFFCIKYESKTLIYSLKTSSLLVFVISIISLIISSAYKTYDYDMNFGYKITFCLFSYLVLLKHSTKLLSRLVFLGLSLCSFVLLILFGSRGPIISVLIFLITYYFLFIRQNLKKRVKKILLISSISILLVYIGFCFLISNLPVYESLSRNLQTILNPFSIFTSKSFFGRLSLYERITDIIKDTPFFGYGPLADQYFLGPGHYSHNLYLEFCITFGVFFGAILIALLFILISTILSLSDEYPDEVLYFAIFLCLCIGRLMVSYSFWYDINFWIMVGSGLMIYSNHLKDEKVQIMKNAIEKNKRIAEKCYFIHFGARKMPGVSKKIDDQLNELNRHFKTIEIDLKPNNTSFVSKMIASIPFFSISRDYKNALNKIKDPTYIYLRNTILDLRLFMFFRQLRKSFPAAKIVLELNTYPYDKCEFGRKNTWIYFYKDFTYRHFYKYCIDRFVVYGDFNKIWGVKTIKTINGIDFSNVVPRNINKNSASINLISVGQYQNHHAYDRLIKGMATYYQNGGDRNIIYHIVGYGLSIDYYKDLVQKYSLGNHVIFYGEKYGKALDEIYNKADIAIATLGFHRIKVKVSSAIKTREYLAKGLPIVYAGIIDIIQDDFKYQYCAQENETSIDLNKIVELYDLYVTDREKASSEIVKYGMQHASISKAFEPIIGYFHENLTYEAND